MQTYFLDIPEYALKWGDVERVASVPYPYDKTISLLGIFLRRTVEHPEGVLVTRSKCESCIADQVPCDRTDPCEYCALNGIPCNYRSNRPYRLSEKKPQRKRAKFDVSSATNLESQTDIAEGKDNVITPLHDGRRGARKRTASQKAMAMEETSDKPPSKKQRLEASADNKLSNIKTTWKVQRIAPKEITVKRIRPQKMPLIWSKTYEEMLGAVPALTTMETWPLGSWDGGKELEISTIRVFSCLSSALSSVEKDNKSSTRTNERIVTEEQLDGSELHSMPEDDMGAAFDMELFPPRLKDDSVSTYLSIPTSRPALLRGPEIPIASTSSFGFNHTPASALTQFREDTSPSVAQGPPRDAQQNTSESMPEDRPDDIEFLFKAYDAGMPVAVIMQTDWPAFPLEMDSMCDFLVVGYFHIIDIKTSVQHFSPQTTPKNGLPRSCGRVTWTFMLRWAPSMYSDAIVTGTADDLMDVDSTSCCIPDPWWFAPGTGSISVDGEEAESHHLVPSAASGSSSRVLYSPDMMSLCVLAPHIVRDGDCAGRLSRSWYCVTCGKINPTYWMGKYSCSYCLEPDPNDPDALCYPTEVVPACTVRESLRQTPFWSPYVVIPKGVVQRIFEWKSGLKRFMYTYTNTLDITTKTVPEQGFASRNVDQNVTSSNEQSQRVKDKGKGKARADAEEGIGTASTGVINLALVVDLLFLGNRTELEEDADNLFMGFQDSVPMAFEKSPSKPTAGIFTYNVFGKGNKKIPGFSNWPLAPECINNARTLMVACARRCKREDISDESITHLSVVAWLGESPVKHEFLAKAKEHPVFLVCLGADFDVLFSDPVQALQKTLSKSKTKSKKGQAKTKAVVHDFENQISDAGIGEEIWGDATLREERKQAIPPTKPDHLRITLTHGSTIMVSGCDVDVTVVRSEFAILLKGYHEP
ncbi:hypothetical protein DFH11DRAFT_578634 [Phellopilus nigrolimitatus]|nr:hypothetical protein DFH11DRAFT_578634 [Phellopilus nigrolimitatus]